MENQFHFDRYQCTFPRIPMEDVCRKLHFISDPMATHPRVKGYRQALSFGEVAYLMHEPTGGDYGCHLLVCGGDTCQPIVEEVRSLLPGHRVSRVDVAVDYDYEGAFRHLEGIALNVALHHKPEPLSTSVGGDHYQLKGRTSYFGSRTSTHFVRVYEKGYEQRSRGINPNASLTWSRCEMEIKPSKKGDARETASKLSPDELAHSSGWTSEIATALGASVVQSVRLTTQRINSHFISTMHHMAKQYGPSIRRAIREGEVTSKEMMQFFRDVVIHGQPPLEGLAVRSATGAKAASPRPRRKIQEGGENALED